MSERYRGRVAVVAGAGRATGLAIIRRLLDEGAIVVVAGRSKGELGLALAGFGASGRLVVIEGVPDDQTHQANAVAHVVETYGRIDLLVNNAGIDPVARPLIDTDLGTARRTFEINVLAALTWVRAAHDAWMQSNGGAVVNLVSVAGLRTAAGIGIHGPSEAAYVHLTGQLAAELGPRIRVNAVAPCAGLTLDALDQQFLGRADVQIPTGLHEVEGVAAAVAFLGSDDASSVTGQTLVVDDHAHQKIEIAC